MSTFSFGCAVAKYGYPFLHCGSQKVYASKYGRRADGCQYRLHRSLQRALFFKDLQGRHRLFAIRLSDEHSHRAGKKAFDPNQAANLDHCLPMRLSKRRKFYFLLQEKDQRFSSPIQKIKILKPARHIDVSPKNRIHTTPISIIQNANETLSEAFQK